MSKLYFSDLQTILQALKTFAMAHAGGTEDLKELIKKVERMLEEEEDRMNRD